MPTEKIAASGIRRRPAVAQFIQLAEVVEHGAGEEQVRIRSVGCRQRVSCLCQLQDMFEEPASIGVVDRQCRRPRTQTLLVAVHDCRQQLTHPGVPGARDPRRKLLPHLFDRPRGARDAVLFPEAFLPIFRIIDAPDLVDPQLELLMRAFRSSLYPHELPGLELVLNRFDVGEHLRRNLPRAVLQADGEEMDAVAIRPEVLTGTEVKRPT